MREIKFRVWDKSNSTWFNRIENLNLLGECTVLGGLFADINLNNLENYIVQQYTGLKDKNGKEIYEGDILIDKLSRSYRVFWNENCAGFDLAKMEPPNVESDIGHLIFFDKWSIKKFEMYINNDK